MSVVIDGFFYGWSGGCDLWWLITGSSFKVDCRLVDPPKFSLQELEALTISLKGVLPAGRQGWVSMYCQVAQY